MKSGRGDFPFFSRTDSIVLTTGIQNPLILLENKTGGVFSRDPNKNNRVYHFQRMHTHRLSVYVQK